MKKTFLQRLKKLILFLALGFVLLFLFRLGHGYTKKVNQGVSDSSFLNNLTNVRNNYATKSYKVKSNPANQSATQSANQVDQKYEKIADIKTKSSKFDNEEKTIRSNIEQNDGIIQFEQKAGNKGYRRLNLIIGVPPEKFDTLYHQLIRVGIVQSKQITKKDKTNEFKELKAKKNSLTQIRNSLIELKSKGGKIEEFVNLENRILDIEQQLQALGVNLGDFDEENEFCTVKLSLIEGKVRTISLTHRIIVALEWTIKTYMGILATLFFITLFSYIILLCIEKLKILERIINKNE